MAKVILNALTKVYENGYIAVDNVTLNIEDHEFMVLVGPSGCGKTTILRMIAGLEEVTSGIIMIDDQITNQIPPKDKEVAMVFQNYALFSHMNVYENIAYGLKRHREKEPDIHKRVMEVVDILNLEKYLKMKPNKLSGGQCQRVALGRAMVMHPKVFLMDEPLSNLDSGLKIQMRLELMKIHRTLRSTFIYVTHDQTEAMTMGTRICVMLEGKIQQVGTPLEIYNTPANIFVADFMGTPKMNLIKAFADQEAGFIDLRMGSLEIKVAKTHVTSVLHYARQTPVTIGIRPNDIRVQHALEGDDKAFEIDWVEILGSEQILHIKKADLTLRVMSTEIGKLKVGDLVHLNIDEAKLHFFDAATGIRL